MGLLAGAAAAAGLLFLLAVRSRRSALIGAAGGLLGGPLFYAWLGSHLARARGEGRFYSFPFGGYRLGDAEVLLSAATWVCAVGIAAYAAGRLLCPPDPPEPTTPDSA